MTRDELHALCFAETGFAKGDPTLEAWDGPDLAASVDIYWRRVLCDVLEVEVCAIGQLCTNPAYRRRGFASALIRAAHELADRRGVRWAALFSSHLSFYTRLGYSAVPRGPRYFLVASTSWPPGLSAFPAGPVDPRGTW